MLRQMAQAKFLGLFDDEEDSSAPPRPATDTTPVAATTPPAADPPTPLPHEDTDLRLQPNDAARCAGAEPGPEPHAGRER